MTRVLTYDIVSEDSQLEKYLVDNCEIYTSA